jgi:hypothetical protein
MTFHLGLTLYAIVTICGLAICAAAALGVLFMMRGEPPSVTRWRPLVIVVLLMSIVGSFAEWFTTARRPPVVVMDDHGVWCAPWPAPVAWANVEEIERIYSWLEDEEDRDEAGPLMDVKLVLKDPDGAAAGPHPWQGLEQPWMRSALWIWRRSFNAWVDSTFTLGGPAAVYCHAASLDLDDAATDMADRFLAQWVQARQQREYEEHRRRHEEIRLQRCGRDDGHSLFVSCSSQVWSANLVCTPSRVEDYRGCMNRELDGPRTAD